MTPIEYEGHCELCGRPWIEWYRSMPDGFIPQLLCDSCRFAEDRWQEMQSPINIDPASSRNHKHAAAVAAALKGMK